MNGAGWPYVLIAIQLAVVVTTLKPASV
jgi:hypothetical protein